MCRQPPRGPSTLLADSVRRGSTTLHGRPAHEAPRPPRIGNAPRTTLPPAPLRLASHALLALNLDSKGLLLRFHLAWWKFTMVLIGPQDGRGLNFIPFARSIISLLASSDVVRTTLASMTPPP